MLLQVLQCLKGALQAAELLYEAVTLVFLMCLLILVVIRPGDMCAMRRRLRHLRKVGVAASNMADQYDSKFDEPEEVATNTKIRIKALYIHPIKSCAPIELKCATLTKTGFLYDRCFAFAIEADQKGNEADPGWRFISQRTKPGMSQIKTEIWLPHKKSKSHDPLVQGGGCIVLTFPDPDPSSWIKRLETIIHTWSLSATPQVSFIIPLQPTPTQIDEFKISLKTFTIHSRHTKGLDMGSIPTVAAALCKLKKFLKIPERQGLNLLRCTPDSLSRTDGNLAPLKYIGSPSVHSYTDDQPININNLSSVHAVSSLLPPENQPLNALRFRANIWITGAPPYEEETWKRYRIVPKDVSTEPRGGVGPTLSVVCRTSRCTMPNVNPDTGIIDTDNPLPRKKKGKPQPSTTLVEHRMVEPENRGALGFLGMHCVPEDRSLKEAEEQKTRLFVEVGDEIEVVERGVHVYGLTANDY